MKYACVYFSFQLTPKLVINGLKNVTLKINLIKAHVGYVRFTSAWQHLLITSHFPSNQNIINLMLINFHISLITKRFFRSFERHSDKTVTFTELLPSINKFRNKILDFFRKFHEGVFQIVRVIVMHVLNPLIF